MLDLESAIRDRAYFIWQAEGKVQGRDLDHWLRAEAETTATLMLAAKPAKPAAKAAAQPAAKPAAKSATTAATNGTAKPKAKAKIKA